MSRRLCRTILLTPTKWYVPAPSRHCPTFSHTTERGRAHPATQIFLLWQKKLFRRNLRTTTKSFQHSTTPPLQAKEHLRHKFFVGRRERNTTKKKSKNQQVAFVFFFVIPPLLHKLRRGNPPQKKRRTLLVNTTLATTTTTTGKHRAGYLIISFFFHYASR